jgi:hypothetical protein
VDKIVIRQRPGTEEQPMSGLNTEVYLNGKKLTSAISIKYWVDAKNIAKVELTMLGIMEIDGNFDKDQIKVGVEKDEE